MKIDISRSYKFLSNVVQIVSQFTVFGSFHFSFKEASLLSVAPKGMEYIFNARPKHQLEISQERLNKWYKLVFGEAKKRAIVQHVMHSTTDMEKEVSYYFCHIYVVIMIYFYIISQLNQHVL